MAEYASKGVAGAGLGLGIAGAALGVANGGLGNLLGGLGMGGNCAYTGGNMPVNRYEAEQAARIAELETEVKLRDANFYTVSEMGKLRDYVDSKFEKVEGKLCEQMAYNAANNATIGCISAQVQQLFGLTKLVVPNTSVCPGWGEVKVNIVPETTTAAG
jgi:hypothetical protein